MFDLKRISAHADLVSRMSEAVGADPLSGVETDESLAIRWRAAVLSCTACHHPEECRKWLSEQEGKEGLASAPPGYCRNSAYLMAKRVTD